MPDKLILPGTKSAIALATYDLLLPWVEEDDAILWWDSWVIDDFILIPVSDPGFQIGNPTLF